MESPSHRPTPEDLLAAAGGTVPDVIGPGLRVLFCGLNAHYQLNGLTEQFRKLYEAARDGGGVAR